MVSILLSGFLPPLARGQNPPAPLSVEDMARSAGVIGVATVQRVQSRKDPSNGLIYTDFTLAFSEVWKGTPADPFILAKVGGELGGQRSAIVGREYRLEVGQPLVVFASESLGGRYAALGLRQGLYRMGSGADPMLFRVSDYPERLGEASSLRLGALRDQVFRQIPRPGTPGDTGRLLPENPSPKGIAAGSPAPTPAPAVAVSETGPNRPPDVWTGASRTGAFLALGILAAFGIFLVLRRK